MTFIELCLLFGGDFCLLPAPDYAAAFVSHDEFFEFHTDDLETATRVQTSLERAAFVQGSGDAGEDA